MSAETMTDSYSLRFCLLSQSSMEGGEPGCLNLPRNGRGGVTTSTPAMSPIIEAKW